MIEPGRELSHAWRLSPLDPATIAAACALLLAVAYLASWLPARRAASIAPAEVLRGD